MLFYVIVAAGSGLMAILEAVTRKNWRFIVVATGVSLAFGYLAITSALAG